MSAQVPHTHTPPTEMATHEEGAEAGARDPHETATEPGLPPIIPDDAD